MATAADPVFIDTSVLVYANVASAPLHTQARSALQALAATGADLWISRQVLHEYLATLSRRQSFTQPVAPNVLIRDILRFQAQFRVANDEPAVTSNLLILLGALPLGGKQIHDANIVATMHAHGILRLLTHNTADFARFGGLIQIEPLVPTP